MGLFTFSKWYVVLMWSVSFLVYNLGFSKSNLFSKGIPSICALLSPRSGTRHTQSLAWCLAMNRPLVSLLNQTFNFTLYFLSLYCFPFHEFSLNSRNHYSFKKKKKGKQKLIVAILLAGPIFILFILFQGSVLLTFLFPLYFLAFYDTVFAKTVFK